VAAHRQGVAHVVVPHGNARSVDELPAEVRAGLAWHPARTMDEVLDLVLRRPAAGPVAVAGAEVDAVAAAPAARVVARPGVRRQRVPKAAQAGGGA
jgi:ATP-dependent Lon protease